MMTILTAAVWGATDPSAWKAALTADTVMVVAICIVIGHVKQRR